MELITGLNEMGVVPEVLWDEPQDWSALGNPHLRATYGGGRLAISSKILRSLPAWLGGRLRFLSLRLARFKLYRYDFVYSFEPGVRMPNGVPNICWVTGPLHLRMPQEQVNWGKLYNPREALGLLSLLTWPLVRPDSHACYVTHSDWIADRFQARYGLRPPVIWPPARSRVLPSDPADRSGFLFLSRLVEYKRAESMLAIARAYPEQKVTIAGVASGSHDGYVASLRERVGQLALSNVQIVENPSEPRVADLLTSHEYFVFPAPWEHFGIVTVEAIQAGLLPLVHDTGGQKEIVPFERLRFSSDQELVDRAEYVLSMPDVERLELLTELRRHVQRGSAEHYREAMLKPLTLLRAAK